MSTLVVVRKNGVACMAADTATNFGAKQQLSKYVAQPGKIVTVGDAYIGFVGSPVHRMVLESLFASGVALPDISNTLELFEFMRALHPTMKEDYFLNPHDEEDDPYESSQMDLFLMNAHGVFGLLSLREVYEYRRFWALGSGAAFALGAMYAAYEQDLTAEAIAELGVVAGIEFDDGSAGPVTLTCMGLAAVDFTVT